MTDKTDNSETPSPLSEEEVRKLVQREIAQRERLREQEKQMQDDRDRAVEEIDRHRRIIEEEKRKYYESHPDYHEYINEMGEVEWLTTEEMREREQLFDDEIEELETGKKRALMLFYASNLYLGIVMLMLCVDTMLA